MKTSWFYDMKKRLLILILITVLLVGCTPENPVQIAATTLPVWEFTAELCKGTELSVSRLITENVSCLHDYSLQVKQVRAIESAEAVVCVGAGFEESMIDVLDHASKGIDASVGVELHCDNHQGHSGGHNHEYDPHIWLSPKNAILMCTNICRELCNLYPEYTLTFQSNLISLTDRLNALQCYGEETLKNLSCRELITFHDGFAYFAGSFDLHILRAIEEESGSEASAQELVELVDLVNSHHLPAVFTEVNGSNAAADVIAQETVVKVYSLDMAISGESYFNAMYRNIDTIKEALG